MIVKLIFDTVESSLEELVLFIYDRLKFQSKRREFQSRWTYQENKMLASIILSLRMGFQKGFYE